MFKTRLIKSLIPIVLLLLISYVSYRFYLKDIYWNNQNQTILIDEKSDSKMIEIKKHSAQKFPYSLELEIEGTTEENTLLLYGPSPDEMTQQIMLKKGNVKFETSSDWEEDNCFLIAHSETDRNFKLNVSYRFITSSY